MKAASWGWRLFDSLVTENHARCNCMVRPLAPVVNGDATMPDKVRCKSCGFLGIRNLKNQEIVEVNSDIREIGKPPPAAITNSELYDPRPICFKRVPEFLIDCEASESILKESRDGRGRLDHIREFNRVTEKERECARFFPYSQSRTPREHEEMTLLEKVQAESQREREESRRMQQEANVKAESRQAAADAKSDERYEEQRRQNEEQARFRRHNKWYWIAAITLGAVSVLISFFKK